MTAGQAIDIERFMDRTKIEAADLFRFNSIILRAKGGINPDPAESQFLQKVYRDAQGGDKEIQPFKAYRRPKSWGV